jgi:hypothetical protein
MLLYAMTSMALVRILAAAHPFEPYYPIVLGFPFSSRPFCDRQPDPHIADETLLGFSDPLVDVALRIAFSQIHLPSVPLDPRASGDRRQIRWQALQSARLAKRQFARMLEPEQLTRDLLHAEAYGRILDRVLYVVVGYLSHSRSFLMRSFLRPGVWVAITRFLTSGSRRP